MGAVIAAAEAAALFERCCRAELVALKPGNVHVFAAGHGMQVATFERAAAAAAPEIAAPGRTVGERIEGAVEASVREAGCNANLGIVLLAAPLLAAAMEDRPGSFQARLAAVLSGLTVVDAEAAYRAIRLASPGGLGAAPEHDVADQPRITLHAAMGAAAARDRIARQYVADFADVFDIGVARLAALGSTDPVSATEAVYLDFLAAFPDTHIARKFGAAVAEQVRQEAEALRTTVAGIDHEDGRHTLLLAFDASLKGRGLNPGTSADLTVASLLAFALEERLRSGAPI